MSVKGKFGNFATFCQFSQKETGLTFSFFGGMKLACDVMYQLSKFRSFQSL